MPKDEVPKMNHRPITLSVLAVSLALAGAVVAAVPPAQAQTQSQAQGQAQAQERIYGSQLMTRSERTEYRNRLRNAKTAEERERIRNEHHERMQSRARERGVTLPDAPPRRGSGAGPGSERGGGMGPGGSGMGPRDGSGR
jgi:uncharacterized membrane protein